MKLLSRKTLTSLAAQHGTPCLVLDCDTLRQQYRNLQRALPGTDFYFAVKAFPQLDVIETLKDCGAGLDIASTGEIRLAEQAGFNAGHCIHTHPIKKDKDIRDALRFGCTTFVVDNLEEIRKFAPYRSRVGLLLRVSFRSKSALVDLSRKFGCSVDEVPYLLQAARALGIHIKGLSFHVGSQSNTPDAHVHAIRQCHSLIEQWEKLSGTPMRILDIGGGFPVDYEQPENNTATRIHQYCKPIRQALSRLPGNLEIIAEPGRYLVAPAATSISTVTGKAMRAGKIWYYLDDGVYNSFSGIIFDHVNYPVRTLTHHDQPRVESTLAGPTCDSIDVIAENILLPDLKVGDLVIADMKGAYTYATATEFNSLAKTTIVTINGDSKKDFVTRIA